MQAHEAQAFVIGRSVEDQIVVVVRKRLLVQELVNERNDLGRALGQQIVLDHQHGPPLSAVIGFLERRTSQHRISTCSERG